MCQSLTFRTYQKSFLPIIFWKKIMRLSIISMKISNLISDLTKVSNQSDNLWINYNFQRQKLKNMKNLSKNSACKTLSKSAHTLNRSSSMRVFWNSQTLIKQSTASSVSSTTSKNKKKYFFTNLETQTLRHLHQSLVDQGLPRKLCWIHVW